eukprot:GILK01002162.1.p1 GENE.GILK01002162.1~~GILK01002162.1.p1  ORF type:complete len:491 (+),score=90.51 GILK01002162.1:72-1475(+)
MQAYKLHVVNEELQYRHPYLQDEFTSDIDPTEVTVAYERRGVTKLVSVLEDPDVPSDKKIEAVQTIRNMMSNQEQKAEAIAEGTVEAASQLLRHANSVVRRECTKLVASLVCILSCRKKLQNAGTVPALARLLKDPQADVRENVMEALFNLSLSRDGVKLLTTPVPENDIINFTISLIVPTDKQSTAMLLKAVSLFQNITRYDDGIVLTLQTGLIRSLVTLISQKKGTFLSEEEIILRSLATLWNIVNHIEAKAEAIQVGAVSAVATHLTHRSADVRRCAIGFLMSITVNEDGKKAAMSCAIEPLVSLLQESTESIRTNTKQTIHNISENPVGRVAIVRSLVNYIPLLEEVFGVKVIKSLASLLNEGNTLIVHSAVVALAHFTASKEGILVALDTVNLTTQLLRTTLNCPQESLPYISQAVSAICKADERTRQDTYNMVMGSDDEVRAAFNAVPNLMDIIGEGPEEL